MSPSHWFRSKQPMMGLLGFLVFSAVISFVVPLFLVLAFVFTLRQWGPTPVEPSTG